MIRRKIFVRGIVQGVGFRPFIYRLAGQFDIKGWVLNSSSGVTIDAEGEKSKVEKFIEQIEREKPVNARIDEIKILTRKAIGYQHFTIRESTISSNGHALISPDLATCPDCQQEIMNQGNRRYFYPFTNCTNCGPRYSIIMDMPYDRIRTTMKNFRMCPTCAAEYHNTSDRRFHAQPNACPECGPILFLYTINRRLINTLSPIETTINLLKNGKIIAIKGLGGFHIAC
ncbi:MAG: acylphosphatase, partial [candidate division WOR-3 bacterium]